MNEDSPNDSPYEMLTKHDQSETKRDSEPENPHNNNHLHTQQIPKLVHIEQRERPRIQGKKGILEIGKEGI
jgi:hypothetical protein